MHPCETLIFYALNKLCPRLPGLAFYLPTFQPVFLQGDGRMNQFTAIVLSGFLFLATLSLVLGFLLVTSPSTW